MTTGWRLVSPHHRRRLVPPHHQIPSLEGKVLKQALSHASGVALSKAASTNMLLRLYRGALYPRVHAQSSVQLAAARCCLGASAGPRKGGAAKGASVISLPPTRL